MNKINEITLCYFVTIIFSEDTLIKYSVLTETCISQVSLRK